MTREEINNLFKKYNVRIPKEKHGQSECKKCKEAHKYSLTWTSFLYEYKEHYYCYEHIVNILLEKENKQLKEAIDKVKKHCEIEINASNHYLQNHSSQQELCHKVAHQRILDILKEVSE